MHQRDTYRHVAEDEQSEIDETSAQVSSLKPLRADQDHSLKAGALVKTYEISRY